MKRTEIYKGRILGLSVYDGEIEGRTVKREIVEHKGAAAMLAFDEDEKLIMVKQHRFPHGHVLEIPAGTLEEGEEPVQCAFRELEEETGYRAREMAPLISYYPSMGYSTEIIHCFVASGTERAGGPRPDDDEILSVQKMDLQDTIAMIKEGRIQDSKTICAVMTYAAREGLF